MLPVKVPPSIDHFCAVVQDYKAQDMRKALDEAAIPMTGTGPASMAYDPDGLRLQLLAFPEGSPGPSFRPHEFPWTIRRFRRLGSTTSCWPLRTWRSTAAYYRKFFSARKYRTPRSPTASGSAASTRLGLEEVAAGRKPRIDHICVRVAGFDRRVAAERLKKLAAEIVPSNDEDLLRFKDPDGIVVELKAGS